MKKILMTAALGLCAASASAGDYTPFVMVDTGTERDSLAHDYINANMTVGVKGPGKMEYSLKFGGSQKTGDGVEGYSRNVEGKIKKSFDIGMPFLPYVAGRLGQKTTNGETGTTIPHWAIDLGLKYPLTTQFAVDVVGAFVDLLADGIDLRLRGIAELDIEGDVVTVDLDVLHRLAGDEILLGIRVGDLLQCLKHLLL